MDMRERGSLRGVLGVGALVVFFAAMLALIAALALSVHVSGESMSPTLADGDRIEVDLLHRDDVDRFDVVEAVQPGEERFGGGGLIVKRVIGLPGDRVRVVPGVDDVQVLLRPAGQHATYRVTSSSWSDQWGTKIAPCCNARGGDLVGEEQGRRGWARVPDGAYWVIGDNWGHSTDSRVFGWVAADRIKATLWWRLTPLDSFGPLEDDFTLAKVGNKQT